VAGQEETSSLIAELKVVHLAAIFVAGLHQRRKQILGSGPVLPPQMDDFVNMGIQPVTARRTSTCRAAAVAAQRRQKQAQAGAVPQHDIQGLGNLLSLFGFDLKSARNTMRSVSFHHLLDECR